MKSLKWRAALILAVLAAALYILATNKITLGLDLRGGSHLVLKVEAKKAVWDEISTYAEEIKQQLEDDDIPVLGITQKGDTLLVELLDPSLAAKAAKVIKKDYSNVFDVAVKNGNVLLKVKQSFVLNEENRVTEQALETIRNRIDQLGVAEPIIVKSGRERIIVELPGIKNPERAKKVIGKVAKLEFMEVVDVADSKKELLKKYGGHVPKGTVILPQEIRDKTGRVVQKRWFLLRKKPILTGAYLKDAYPSTDQYGMPAVSFELKKQGAKIFERYTASHIGTRLAIVLDNKVQSAPVIRSKIGAQGQITGQFTYEEAKELAIVLRAGALPAPVKIIEETTIGPTLGKESIQKGIQASVAGLIVVMLFMAFYYRVSGIVADIALFMNMILLLALLALLGATLTLPGIAGFILTIGMSVDANVLIFERIREELKKGRSLLSAVEVGFSEAWRTILDANVTTLASAAVLFQFGTGPVKGFAVTLSLGILCSLFTAVFVTKVIIDFIVKYKPSFFSV